MPPAAIASDIAALDARAQLHHTPCGAGQLVWRAWPAPAVRVGEGGHEPPPVVLLHGGSGSWTHWLRNIDALVAEGRRVLVPDLPGFGDSALPPAGGDADAIFAPLEAGLQQLVGDVACDLVGFSFGGMAAGLWAAQHPARAARLVLVGAPAMGVVPTRQFELKAWRHLTDEAAREAVHRHNLAALMLHDVRLIDGLALQLHTANVVRDRMPRRRLSSTDILARSLASVPCPVLAIYGAHDALYKQWISQLGVAFEQATPHFRGLELIADAGHWVQFEQAAAFNRALRRALAG